MDSFRDDLQFSDIEVRERDVVRLVNAVKSFDTIAITDIPELLRIVMMITRDMNVSNPSRKRVVLMLFKHVAMEYEHLQQYETMIPFLVDMYCELAKGADVFQRVHKDVKKCFGCK
jgi:hypothetical protein